MTAEFADALLFDGRTGPLEALERARRMRMLAARRPFVRAVPGGWLVTPEADARLVDERGRPVYEFAELCPGVKIGFKREGENG